MDPTPSVHYLGWGPILEPRGPSTLVLSSSARRDCQRTVIGANPAHEKLSNRECRSEERRQHQDESAAPGGLAMGHLFFIVARLSHDLTEQDLVETRRSAIKPGSANVGLAGKRSQKIGP